MYESVIYMASETRGHPTQLAHLNLFIGILPGLCASILRIYTCTACLLTPQKKLNIATVTTRHL